MINPKFDESRLLGLTRQEVLQRLGPPSYDPMDPKWGATYTTRPWNEAEDGGYLLAYYQGWAPCGITFKNGKVDSVRKSWK